jgi:hypothetical protein
VPTVGQLPYQPFVEQGATGFRWRLGLRPLDLADWFDGGPDATGWIADKQLILAEHHETAFAVLDDIEPESAEVAIAIAAHLTARAGTAVDLPADQHPLEAASRLVAEDLVLMVERDGRLVVGGGSVCFPNRWDLRSKLGRTLREVHAPVALLNDQLGDPVARFLERLAPERAYWRLGWGIIDVPDGYTPVDGTGPHRPSRPRPDDLYVRVERETLRRFPLTDCVLFTIRTYVSPLGVVASDPVARERMAGLVDSMPPELRDYKDLRGIGDDVVRYLRSSGRVEAEVDIL